ETVAAFAGEQGVMLTPRPPAEPQVVLGVRDRVLQVFVNLLANAIKFSPRGGQVEVRWWREQGCAVAQISDQGPGIPTDKLAAIFEPFTQLDSQPKRHAAEGWSVSPVATGAEALASLEQQPVDLILAALELSDMHGLDFVQQVRRGAATFDTHVLVVSDADASDTALDYGAEGCVPADPQALIGQARRLLAAPRQPVVLLVDDDPAVRDGVTKLLRRAGYACFGVSD